MTEETTSTADVTVSEEQARAADNPMLARNQVATESKTDDTNSEPEKAALATVPEDRKAQPSSTLVKDALGSLESDPQLKPVGDFIMLKMGDKVDTDRAFGKAVERGDTSLIDEAYLREVLGDEADTVIGLAKGLFDAAAAKADAAVKSLYQAHGGENTVRQAVSFYNAKSDPSERAAMALLLDSGNQSSIDYALKHIINFSTGAGGVKSAVPATIPLGQPSAQRGLSAAEYQKLVGEAHFKRQPSSEFDRLASLRRLGKQQGI